MIIKKYKDGTLKSKEKIEILSNDYYYYERNINELPEIEGYEEEIQ